MATKFKKKLTLNKKTVVNLHADQMKHAQGASEKSVCNDCFTFDTMCAICTWDCTDNTWCAICTYNCHN